MKNTDYKSDIELLNEILAELKKTNLIIAANRPATDNFQYIDNADLLKLLKITDRTAIAWRKKGTLPYTKIHGKIFYRIADIETMMKERFKRSIG